METQEIEDVKPKLEESPECQTQEIVEVEEITHVIPVVTESNASALPTTVITPRHRMITTAGRIR